MEPLLLQRAIFYARRGERLRAYQLLQAILCETPQCVEAWLWMSGVVQDPQRQRECLERALTIDPDCVAARRGLHMLLRPRPAPRAVMAPPQPQRLGEYLVQYGFVTPIQRLDALSEQRRRKLVQNQWVPLGMLLLESGALTVHMLATALMMQLQAQLTQGNTPARLGAVLVARGWLTVEHLGAALTHQLTALQQGKAVQLGAVLVRERLITEAQLTYALSGQRSTVTTPASVREMPRTHLLASGRAAALAHANLSRP